jgi:hypothetical protein
MRKLLIILAAIITLPQAVQAQPATADPVEVATFTVELRPRDTAQSRVGRLHYLGGIVLRSDDRRFGGISGLRFVDDDTQLLAISDRGNWITFRPTFDGARLVGAAEVLLWPILGASGSPVEAPHYDAESLTFIDDIAFVGFERVHRIDAFGAPLSGDNPHPESFRDATPFGERENNGGLEGLTTLPGGRLLGIVEAASEHSTFDGWIMNNDGHTEGLALFAQDPFSLTDLATLPNGDVVTLERRFSPIGGVGARLRLIPADRIQPGALLDGEVLAELGAGYTVDNMEGIAVRETGGRTEIFIISDDNQNPLQRTILMAFELLPE